MSFFEPDSVLFEIGFVFLLIPLESHALIVCYCIYKGKPPRFNPPWVRLRFSRKNEKPWIFQGFSEVGGLGAKTDAQIPGPHHPHDTIRFFPKSKERIFEVCQPLYSAGCSLREIEQKTGFAKTSIREALTSRGYTLRRTTKGPKQKSQRSTQMRSPVLPFGYEWLDGKLVLDPKEYRVVQKILQLWQKGTSARVIADQLNQQKIPTRMGKRWFHSSVNAVIKRHQQSKTET